MDAKRIAQVKSSRSDRTRAEYRLMCVINACVFARACVSEGAAYNYELGDLAERTVCSPNISLLPFLLTLSSPILLPIFTKLREICTLPPLKALTHFLL